MGMRGRKKAPRRRDWTDTPHTPTWSVDFLELEGYLKPSLGRLGASWLYVGGYIEPLSTILSHLGGHGPLRPSWSHLGPSWTL
eukprot:485059-Pyramimonas_sp.AAC.1